MDLAALPAIETLIGLAGAPITLLLTHTMLRPFSKLPKSAHGFGSIIVGILWNLAAIAYAHGDLARAPALGILSGLAATGIKHGYIHRQRVGR